MDNAKLKESIREILPVNGYAYFPSCVCEPGDKEATRLRSVTISTDGAVAINADGPCLESIKRSIREKCPGVVFADEQPKPVKRLKEPTDGTTEKS